MQFPTSCKFCKSANIEAFSENAFLHKTLAIFCKECGLVTSD